MMDDNLAWTTELRATTAQHTGNTQRPLLAVQPGDELSPPSPLIAQARVEGYRRQTKILTEDKSPYHGNYFKILRWKGAQEVTSAAQR
jgi:hypothetical protein